jgi:RIB43A
MERKSRERAEKAASIAAEAAQVAALSSSSLLTEDRSQTYGRGGYGKVRVDHFKGFSQQEVDAIRAEQERQRLELEASRPAMVFRCDLVRSIYCA